MKFCNFSIIFVILFFSNICFAQSDSLRLKNRLSIPITDLIQEVLNFQGQNQLNEFTIQYERIRPKVNHLVQISGDYLNTKPDENINNKVSVLNYAVQLNYSPQWTILKHDRISASFGPMLGVRRNLASSESTTIIEHFGGTDSVVNNFKQVGHILQLGGFLQCEIEVYDQFEIGTQMYSLFGWSLEKENIVNKTYSENGVLTQTDNFKREEFNLKSQLPVQIYIRYTF